MLRVTKLLIVFAVACGGINAPSQATSQVTDGNTAAGRVSGFTVELPAAAFLRDLDDRERREQMRDWGVLATLAHEGATPEQTAAATYQMPAARLPYLDEMYSFTYGRGRRAYFGDRVLLFVDADDRDRTATIGRLADQVRMELGEIPRNAEIYVVDDQRNEGTLQISEAIPVEGARLFSADYGYVEADVSDAKQLSAWLSRIDDLARVRIEPGKLVLGGRRFASSRTQGVTIDDIAALYQAPARIRERKAAAQRELDQLSTSYKAEYERRLADLGIEANGRYTKAEIARLSPTVERVAAETKAATRAKALAVVERTSGGDEPGFSLDPLWLPAPGGTQPLMLARLQQLAKDPCAEIARIARLAPKLLADQPDETRRSGEAWAASDLVTLKLSSSTCVWLHGFVGNQLGPVITQLKAALPHEWRAGFAPLAKLKQKLAELLNGTTEAQQEAIAAIDATLSFYRFETGAQCARYDGIEGTAVGTTLFYTDLLAKLWQVIDFAHSAPVHAVPGFLTSPRVDISPEFGDEMRRLPATRIWFAPRVDGWSRSAAGTFSELAFLHRFSRVYAAGRDPAEPGKETTPNEPARLSIGWWDRHFDEVADYEQQYHRQNQIMKWSTVTATMLEMTASPAFLASVPVDRSARFFPWLAAHRGELRFRDLVPERSTPHSTECIALLNSYPFTTAGSVYDMSGGVSLAGPKVVKAAPIVKPSLPRGQRVVPAAGAPAVPRRVLEGRTVAIKDAANARGRWSEGSVNLRDVSARFEGSDGATAVTLSSPKGKLSTVELARTSDGVRIDVHAGPVEQARAVLAGADRETSVVFEGRSERIVLRNGEMFEVKQVVSPSPDGAVTAVAHDAFPPGWAQARAADVADVHRSMDTYRWQVVSPGKHAWNPPTVRFRNEPPPASARRIDVKGLDGVTTARATNSGEVYFERPLRAEDRAAWHDIGVRPGGLALDRGKTRLDMSPRPTLEHELQEADQIAHSGRLEDAAPLYERHRSAAPGTDNSRARDALNDVAHGRATAARNKLDAMLASRARLSAEARSLLVDGLRNHGERDLAAFMDKKLQGKPMPAGMSLGVDRGRPVVRYEARRIETLAAVDPHTDLSIPIKYLESRGVVGREGLEPDLSGPIARWLHEPALDVHEMKASALELPPAANVDVIPEVIYDKSTGRQYRRAHDPANVDLAHQFAPMVRFYVLSPANQNQNQNNNDDDKRDERCDEQAGSGCMTEHKDRSPRAPR